MSAPVIFPQPAILNLAGIGLNEGKVYIGVAGQDPVTNPQATYWDAALTIPAAQPLPVLGGYLMYLGSPSFAWTTGSYSFAAYAKDGTLVYQDTLVIPGFNSPAGPAGEDASVIVTWTGGQTVANQWLGGENIRVPITLPANFAGSGGRAPGINPAATYTVTVKKNGSTVGTATCSTAGAWSFASSGGASVSFAVGDVFDAYGSGDTTMADFSLTFKTSVSA